MLVNFRHPIRCDCGRPGFVIADGIDADATNPQLTEVPDEQIEAFGWCRWNEYFGYSVAHLLGAADALAEKHRIDGLLRAGQEVSRAFADGGRVISDTLRVAMDSASRVDMPQPPAPEPAAGLTTAEMFARWWATHGERLVATPVTIERGCREAYAAGLVAALPEHIEVPAVIDEIISKAQLVAVTAVAGRGSLSRRQEGQPDVLIVPRENVQELRDALAALGERVVGPAPVNVWVAAICDENMAPTWLGLASTAEEADELLFERLVSEEVEFEEGDEGCAWAAPLRLGAGVIVGSEQDTRETERWMHGGEGFASFLAEMVRRHREKAQ